MDINYLIQLLGNRLNGLNLAKDQAFSSGDLDRINTIDSEIASVQNTLSKLNLILSLEQAASTSPFTEAEVLQNGIEASLKVASLNAINDLNNSSNILLGYDISSYATDPLHEEKIADILKYIGDMDSPSRIDLYIESEAIGSPVTGNMIYTSAQKYNVDIRLLMALMELDSRFGTAGVAVRTLNPGNVGNDGTNTYTYASWEDGVDAVAKWLDNHRAKASNVVIDEPVITPDTVIVPTPEPEPTLEPTPEPEPVPEPKPTPDVIPETEPAVETPVISKGKRNTKLFS